MKVRFGLYFIPDSGEFYETGSKIVGYDIRKQQLITPFDFIQPSWIEANTLYGFHLTITDALYVEDYNIPDIISEIEEIIGCFAPTNEYSFTKESVKFWGDASTTAILRLKPNRNVEMLHDVLAASVAHLGIGSEYLDRYTADQAGFTPNSSSDIRKIKRFYSPYIFDGFIPHFTCISGYDGPSENRDAIESRLNSLFEGFHSITMNKLALVVQIVGEPLFTIQKEFNLHSEGSVHET